MWKYGGFLTHRIYLSILNWLEYWHLSLYNISCPFIVIFQRLSAAGCSRVHEISLRPITHGIINVTSISQQQQPLYRTQGQVHHRHRDIRGTVTERGQLSYMWDGVEET